MKHRVLPDPTAFPSLGALLDDALARNRSLDALIEADRKREASRWTYGALDLAARRLAARLEALGVGPGDRVGVLLSNSPRWAVTAIAAFRRGAVLVPLDIKLDAPEQAALCAHAGLKALAIEHPLWRKRAEPWPADAVLVAEAPDGLDLGAATRWEDVPADAPAVALPGRPEDLATIVYSSGTGGRPKGCRLTHRAYLAQLDGLLERYPMGPGDTYFSVLPTNHAIDFMVGMVGPFVCGATVVHQRTLRPEMLRFTMQRYGATHLSVVPMLLAAFDRAISEKLDALPAWQRAAVDAVVAVNDRLTERAPSHALSSRLLAPIHAAFGGKLRLVICGGAWTDREVAERLTRFGIPVVIGYGLTEACTVVTVNGTTPPRADSVGSPVKGVEVRIDAPGPDGVGEVCVRGPTLMEGYLDDPELTAETIRDGWLHTGDLGWLDASDHLHLVGRIKDVIVTAGGKNVYPEDIEHAFGSLPCEEVAVFAANTLWPRRTMADEQLVLVVRPKDGEPPLAAIGRANRALPDFKRVSGVLVVTEPFPRTASMKLKRRELAATLGVGSSRDRVLPLTELALQEPRP